MADLVQINSHNPGVLMISKQDTYGGVQFTIGEGYQLKEMMDWYRKYQEQLMRESKAREENESVAAAYKEYQTVLNLVLDIT